MTVDGNQDQRQPRQEIQPIGVFCEEMRQKQLSDSPDLHSKVRGSIYFVSTSIVPSTYFGLPSQSQLRTTHSILSRTIKMPRRSGGAPARAPPRPQAPPARAPQPQQQRPYSATAAPPKQQQAPPAQASQGPGLFGQMASTAA
jgi:hypothetical protein